MVSILGMYSVFIFLIDMWDGVEKACHERFSSEELRWYWDHGHGFVSTMGNAGDVTQVTLNNVPDPVREQRVAKLLTGLSAPWF